MPPIICFAKAVDKYYKVYKTWSTGTYCKNPCYQKGTNIQLEYILHRVEKVPHVLNTDVHTEELHLGHTDL